MFTCWSESFVREERKEGGRDGRKEEGMYGKERGSEGFSREGKEERVDRGRE